MNRERNFSGKTVIAAVQYGKEGEYWLDKFSGDLQKTVFPYNYPKTNLDKDGEKREDVKFEFNPRCVSQLLELSKGLAHRLYIILAANLVVLLYKYTGNKDIIIGSPILKQQMDGDFINTALALRTQVSDDITFKELLLDRVRPTITEANQHQNYPIETLLFRLNMSVRQGDFPLFDVAILLENVHEKKYIHHTHPNIIFSFLLTGSDIKGTVEYNPLLYEKSSVEKIAGHFKRLVEEVVFHIDIPISRVEILSTEEKRQLLEEFNDTGSNYPAGKTIDELFVEQVAQRPDHIALTYEGEPKTYKQLNEEANRLASYLRFLGVAPEEPVVLMVENSYRVILSILGVLKSGGAYLPINIDYPDQRKKYIINDSGAKRMLTNIEVGKPDPGITSIHLDDAAIYQCPPQSTEGSDKKCRPGNLAYIMYTSGSTGVPKGVMVNHRNVVRLVKNTNYVEFEEGDSILLTGALEFDASTFEIWGALLNGLTLHLVSKETLLNLHLLKQVVTQNGVTTMWMTAPLFNQVLDADIEIFTGLKHLLVGGDVLSPPHIYRLKNHSPKLNIINGYGPTENTTFSTTYRVDDHFRDNIPIGKPIGNSTVYILDRGFYPVPPGALGELYVGGDGVSRGYLNQPELTHERFSRIFPDDRLYCTGDLARWLPDGNIEFSGRIDQQVKIRGYRIELGEIENRLRQIDFIKEAVLKVKKDKDEEKFLCAYVVTDNDDAFDALELKKILSRQLPDYMVPAYFLPLDEIPLTPNGKVDWRVLPEPESIGIDLSYTAPRNSVEKKFVEVWSEVLKIEKDKIGIDSDFFELGGHSLKATILISKLHKAFNVKVPLAELFKTPTIRELALYIKKLTTHRFSSIHCAEKREYYQLSSAQKRLYILQQLELTGTSYNVPRVLIVEGVLDREKLENTFRKLIERHESFKTSFELINENPVQKVQGHVDFKINYSRLTNNDKEEIVRNFIKPFNLSQAPLMRVELIRLSPEKEKRNPVHIMMIDIHHIITDGTSMDLLVKEFTAYYVDEELSPLRLQYKDYGEWENSKEQKEVIQRQETYWRKQFAGEIPVLNLPVDYPRPAMQSFEGVLESFPLDPHQSRALHTMALEEGVSLYILLLAVTNVFLSKLSNQEDIVIGTPIAARRHVDLEPIIGMFVNTLAMRNYPVVHKNFRDFLREVKERSLDAFENQEYQFEDLVEKVTVNRDASRNPLFDVMVALPNMEAQTGNIPLAEIPELEIKSYEHEYDIAKFDLDVSLVEASDRLILVFNYCTKLFTGDTIKRFVEYLKQIINIVIEEPDKKIADIDIVPAEEKNRLLFDFNSTEMPYPQTKTVIELIEKQAVKSPDHIALKFENSQVTYDTLNADANRLARKLRFEGMLPDSIAVVMLERSVEMIIGILGVLKAGGAYLPIAPEYPPQRVEHILKDSKAKWMVVKGNDNETLLDKVAFTGSIIPLRSNIHLEENPENPEKINTPENLAYVIYTSGSTGKPKGVMVEHGNIVAYIYAFYGLVEINSGDIIIQQASYSFDTFVEEVYPILLRGGKIVIPKRYEVMDVNLLYEFILKNSITILDCSPLLLNELNKMNLTPGFPVRTFISGGDALEGRYIDKLIKIGKIYNGYGPTEITVCTTFFECTDELKSNVPIGTPISNYRVYILDKNNRLLSMGIPGELCVAGDGVTRGYLNRVRLTGEKFSENPYVKGECIYHTGDLARWLPDGNIEFLGRIDHQIKIRGYRIELEEIEILLSKHPQVKEAVVLVREEAGDKYLCAYIVPDGEKSAPLELREYLSGRLPDYMIPSYFVQIDDIPLTSNGKINRNALPEPQLEAGRDYAAPRDLLEVKMVELWEAVLGIKKDIIGIDSNFFQLGGHSLKATVLIARMHKELDVKLPLAELFKTPRIRELSAYIKMHEKDKYISIESVEKREYYMLSSAQKRLYVLQQMELESTAYNMPELVPLNEELHKIKQEKTFKKIIEKLIQRHESLRTLFHRAVDEPVQKVCDEVEFAVEYYEGTENSEDIRHLLSRFIRPFDLSRAPLLRVGLLKTAGERYFLLVDMHHIISDGVSHEILVKDFMSFYEGEEPPSLRIQYKDFSQWQMKNSQTQRGNLELQENYWLKVFKGNIPELDLPLDYPRPELQNFEGGIVNFEIGVPETEALKTFAAEEASTMFMVLLALFNVFLSKITLQDDIIIGTPTAGRRHADLEPIIGMFVNTLPLRNHPNGEKTFTGFLKELRETTLQAFENQDYQFENLLEKLSINRNTGRNPLFDVMFSLQNLEAGQGRESKAKTSAKETRDRQYEYDYTTSKFDLSLDVAVGEKLHFSFEYCSKLFKKTTIEKYVNHFEEILSSVLKNKNIKLEEIRLTHHLLRSKPKKPAADFGF